MMARNTTIDVANQFSRWPAGRVRRDGRYSGERFRQDFLVPALRKQEGTVTIKMDGAAGYGPSFLEEAFGGLIRKEGFGKEVLSRLNIETRRNNRKELIREAIRNATPDPGTS